MLCSSCSSNCKCVCVVLSRIMIDDVLCFQNNPPQHIVDKLFHFFTGWLSLSEPPTELLYLLAILKPSHDINQVYIQ